jgi:hypothetical protein
MMVASVRPMGEDPPSLRSYGGQVGAARKGTIWVSAKRYLPLEVIKPAMQARWLQVQRKCKTEGS